jgi:hypothetical protein
VHLPSWTEKNNNPRTIVSMGNAKIPVIGGEKIWEGIADSITSLNPSEYFKMHVFSLLGAVIIIMRLCFCVLRTTDPEAYYAYSVVKIKSGTCWRPTLHSIMNIRSS